MSWFQSLFGRKPADPILPREQINEDGSMTQTFEFQLSGDTREIRDDVVSAIDEALSAHGELLHAIDPSRIMRFDAGGPPVWSVGMVTIEKPEPYWLWVTYGFSSLVTPVDYRAEYQHEYSIAIPRTSETPPVWPAALLRHLCRYVLNSRAELRVGDNMPCHAPITFIPFQPEHHPMMPMTALDSLLVGVDPLVPAIDTPAGPLEVRRFFGLRPEELELVQRWSGSAFYEELLNAQPRVLTDVTRASLLEDADYRQTTEARAQKEGSSLGMLFVQGGWRPLDEDRLAVHFPGGAQARMIKQMVAARLPFDRSLLLGGPPDLGAICFLPSDRFMISLEGGTLCFRGSEDQLRWVLADIREQGQGSVVHVQSAPDGSWQPA
jgi:hypothetical protein